MPDPETLSIPATPAPASTETAVSSPTKEGRQAQRLWDPESDAPQRRPHSLKRLLLIWLAIFGAWTILALAFASQVYVFSRAQGQPETWTKLLLQSFVNSYTWALMAPLIIWVASRIPVERHSWFRGIAMHLVPAAACTVLFMFLATIERALLKPLLDEPQDFWDIFGEFASGYVVPGFMWYGVTVLVYYALDYYSKYRERKIRASQLEARLAQAQLQVLRMQLQPHFLFNTLNAITALMHKNVDGAERMITSLSDLLRQSLESVGKQEVPLSQELRFLRHYVGIEMVRLGDRVNVEFHIDEKARDALVPNLILQPLVENAIRHGIAPRAAPGHILIEIEQYSRVLKVRVVDDGIGLTRDKNEILESGVGLSNTRLRLEQLYGAHHRFGVSGGELGGFEVFFEIPFRTAETLPETSKESS